MAHFEKVLTGSPPRQARSGYRAKAQQTQHEEALKQANELQVELARRAQTPLGNDPLLSFDSSMSRAEVRAKFMTLVQRSREAVFA
ncbi:MAG: hypothetical protein WA191_18450 [Telluria sp.]|nr:hypothetical protein [Telluria sp.]